MELTFENIEKLIAISDQKLDPWLEERNPLSHPYYRFLYHLVLNFKPKVAVELGTSFGRGSAHMCAAAKTYGGQVVGLDVNYHKLAAEELPAKFDKYQFLQGDACAEESVNKVQDIVDEYGQIELLYQDSSHHYLKSKEEWRIYRPLTKHGIWICDDISAPFHDPLVDPPGKGMVQYFDELPGNKRLYDNLHLGNVQGIII